MPTEANIIRLAVDLADPYRNPVNKLNGEKIKLPRSKDIRLELGVYERGIWVRDVESYLASITVEIKATRTGAATVTVTEAGPFILTEEAEWNGGENKQHATITLPNGQTAGFTIGSTGEAEYWLVITAATLGGKGITLAAGAVTAIEDGGNYSAATPVVGDSQYVTYAALFPVLQRLIDEQINENGFKGRWGIDENGLPIFRQA